MISDIGVILAQNVAAITGILVSAALVVFAAVTWRESRRQARIMFISQRLEKLYSPIYHAIEDSKGNLFDHIEVIIDASPTSRTTTTRQYWNESVAPKMRKFYYLASHDLQEAYWRVRKRIQDDQKWDRELGEAFSHQVVEDYESLVKSMSRLTGRIS